MTEYVESESFQASLYLEGSNPKAFLTFQNASVGTATTGHVSSVQDIDTVDLVDVDYLCVSSITGRKTQPLLFKRIVGNQGTNYHVVFVGGPYANQYLAIDEESGKIRGTSEPSEFAKISQFDLKRDGSYIIPSQTDFSSEPAYELVCYYGGVELDGKKKLKNAPQQCVWEVNGKTGAHRQQNFCIRLIKKNTLSSENFLG